MTGTADLIERLVAELERLGVNLSPLQIADALLFAAKKRAEEPVEAAQLPVGTTRQHSKLDPPAVICRARRATVLLHSPRPRRST